MRGMLLTAVLIVAISMNLDLTSGEIDEEEFNEGNGIAKDQHVYGDLILTPYQEKKMTSGVAAGEKDEEEINRGCGIAKNPDVYGDLILTPEQKKIMIEGGNGAAQGFLYAATRWPNGEIPFKLDGRLNSKAKRAITAAMDEIEEKTCITFVDGSNKANFVYFTPKRGCYSYFGMIGGGQDISIGRGCEYKGIVQHEILHALGRIHEQSRMDRDEYVQIKWENIRSVYSHNFAKMSADQQDLSYDYGSIMHYGAYDFSSNGQPTITPLQDVTIGQREALSDTDWTHIQKAYC